MQRALSTYLFVEHRLTAATLDHIWDAGIPLVEIFAARQHFDYRDRMQFAELGYWLRDSELKVHSLHSPLFSDDVWGRSGPNAVLDITEQVKSRRMNVVEEIKRALEVAETIPFRYLIQHLGMTDAEYDPRKIDAAFSSLEQINVFAKERGVEVLLENTPNDLSSAQRLLLFLEATHLDLNFCFDIGHANLKGGIDTEYRLMKSRIRSTHIHDNDGKNDSHLFPTVAENGTVDWPRGMDTLRSQPDRYPLLLELREVPEMAKPLEAVKRVFENLEKSTAQTNES